MDPSRPSESSSAQALKPQLESLAPTLAAAKEYLRAARSAATRRAYAADWRDFSCWAEEHGLLALPAQAETVALYLVALAESGCKASTITRRLSAISLAHRQAGHPSPCDRSQRIVSETLQGIRRTLGTRPRGKEPLSLDLLKKAVKLAEGTLAASRDRAILLVGFAGGLRRSELAEIRIEDLHWHKRGITVHIEHSKTDQEGQGREVELPYGSQPDATPLDELTCPVRALEQWLKIAGIKEGKIFRRVTAAQTIGAELDPHSIARIIKQALARVGLTPKQLAAYGAHSLRAGFATTAWLNGASELAIMRQTGHKSNAMVRRYIRAEKADRIAAASKLGL